jgi:hypothetical protein
MTARCNHTQDAAAWTLGALDDADATKFAAHLDDCSLCKSAVKELMPVAELLGMSVLQVAPTDALKSRIMGVVASEAQLLKATGPEADLPPAKPKRRFSIAGVRPALAGAVACALLATGLTVGMVIKDDGGPSPTKTFSANAHPGMTAVATVAADQVTLHLNHMESPPPGRVYQVWLQRGGKVVPTRTLFVPSGGKATITVDQGLKGADRVMITDERMGGSKTPSGTPYVDAQLS